jgi:hypothetical protein
MLNADIAQAASKALRKWSGYIPCTTSDLPRQVNPAFEYNGTRSSCASSSIRSRPNSCFAFCIVSIYRLSIEDAIPFRRCRGLTHTLCMHKVSAETGSSGGGNVLASDWCSVPASMGACHTVTHRKPTTLGFVLGHCLVLQCTAETFGSVDEPYELITDETSIELQSGREPLSI